MSQVFISYAHASPDQELARQLSEFLSTNGFNVFVDANIRLGQDWVEQIDTQLRRSKYFVVLLSPASIQSDMVRREIAIAYKLKRQGELTIFPVRLAFEGELPYDIGAYLDLIQYTLWRAHQPFEPVCHTILDAMSGAPAIERARSAPSRSNGPLAEARDRFDAGQLESVRRELARHVGPMACVIVDRAARKAANWQQLYELLATEVPAGEERKRFLATRPR